MILPLTHFIITLTTPPFIDFTGGVQDVLEKQIRIIGDAETRYKEDPVRMLRAVRFSAKLHFTLAPETAAPFPQISQTITHCIELASF